MNILNIINKKRLHNELSKEEIEFFVNGYTKGDIPDYQISSLLMAICINGMTEQETFFLTDSMKNSGDTLSFKEIKGITVDKHSTGGVSDTTSVALIPILACAGLYSIKMSGAGLGFTGGTTDKLQVFKGISLDFDIKKNVDKINKNGACFCSQSVSLAPADKKIYALRDITETVESIPLIASSIMSKKLACGNDLILLDVKTGNGAFMKDLKSAEKLAKLMVKIGKTAGRKMGAIISDMNEPLGNGVGCTLEIADAINVLKGEKNKLFDVVKILAIKIMTISNLYSLKQAEQKFDEIITSGEGLKKLQDIVESQCGDFNYALEKISSLKPTKTILAKNDGYVSYYDTSALGYLVCSMGGGRETLTDIIDLDCGIFAYKKIGDKVKKGDKLFDIYLGSKLTTDEIEKKLQEIMLITDKKTKKKQTIYKVIL